MLHEQALPASLEDFEYTLETPIIPGELEAWSSNAKKACTEAATPLSEHVPTWHKRVLDDIRRQDSALSRRVQQLRDGDAELLEQARELKANAEKIAAKAKVVESHDAALKQAVGEFIEGGLNWIIETRKQEAALTAWYQESFNRDRGVAD